MPDFLAAGRVPRSPPKDFQACQRVLPTPWLVDAPGLPRQGANPLGAGLQTCTSAQSHSSGAPFLHSSPLWQEETQGPLLVAPATGSGCTRLGALLPEEAFTREEQIKVLQKRTRNIAALGTAPALAGKLRHALEGMRVPLEDNQRFQVSPTSSCLQSQGN